MDDATSNRNQDGSVRSNGRSAPSANEASVAPPGGASGPIYSFRLKILVVVVVAASVAALSFGYVRTSNGDGESSTSPDGDGMTSSHPGVEALHPAESSQVLQQQSVGVDLVPGWNGRLIIGDQPIPEDDLTRSSRYRQEELDRDAGVVAEDRLEFVPGPDKVMRHLPTGRVCAQAQLWRRASGPEGSSSSIEWCFNVL